MTSATITAMEVIQAVSTAVTKTTTATIIMILTNTLATAGGTTTTTATPAANTNSSNRSEEAITTAKGRKETMAETTETKATMTVITQQRCVKDLTINQ